MEVTRIGVAQVPYSETFRLAKFRLFSIAFRGRAKLSIFSIGLTLEERYDDQSDPFSSLTLYSPFLPVTQLVHCKSWARKGSDGANFANQRLEENKCP